MNLARAIHFDESASRVHAIGARTGEWCIPGGFEFSDPTEDDLVDTARRAFANGWPGLGMFGRITSVAVTRIEPAECDALVEALAAQFADVHGAPALEAAHPVAAASRLLEPRDADLAQVAAHGDGPA